MLGLLVSLCRTYFCHIMVMQMANGSHDDSSASGKAKLFHLTSDYEL